LKKGNRVLDFLIKLQTLDRRLIYVLVAVLVFLPLVWKFSLPMFVSPPAQSFFNTVEAVPDDKLVIVACDFGAGTRGENEPQARATIEHLMKSGKKFAILGFDIQGPEFAQSLAEKAQKKYQREYGQDWCNWGFKTGGSQTLMGLAKDVPGTIKEDREGRPIRSLKVMEGIHTIQDIGLIAEFTGAGMLPMYIQFIQGVYGTPLVQGCTGIIGPEQYPYLDSGQLKGLLVGMKGAAEYEKLVGYEGDGTRAMIPQSVAHLLLMGLIVLGNVGLFAARRREQRASRKEPEESA